MWGIVELTPKSSVPYALQPPSIVLALDKEASPMENLKELALDSILAGEDGRGGLCVRTRF